MVDLTPTAFAAQAREWLRGIVPAGEEDDLALSLATALGAVCDAARAERRRGGLDCAGYCPYSLEWEVDAFWPQLAIAAALEEVRQLREALEQIAHPDQPVLHTSVFVLQQIARLALTATEPSHG